jgi:hypothetical protein
MAITGCIVKKMTFKGDREKLTYTRTGSTETVTKEGGGVGVRVNGRLPVHVS